MSGWSKKWSAFWEARGDALHHSNDPDFLRRCATELTLLFPSPPPKRILEIGCGGGDLLKLLGFLESDYKGIDGSPAMEALFRQRYPKLAFSRADGTTYRDDSKYDLVFSNGVAQYFDRAMLSAHFQNARAMMNKDSRLVVANVPWKSRKYLIAMGWQAGTPSRSRAALGYVKSMLAKNRMGKWWSLREFSDLAGEAGLEASYHGSMFYFYRFHAVLKVA